MKCCNYRTLALFFVLLAVSTSAIAQDSIGNYALIAKDRAEKIVAQMDIKNKVQEERVIKLIAAQYQNLNDLHAKRGAAIRAVGSDTSQISLIKANTELEVKKLHTSYLEGLTKELSPAKIEQVKDGMTYNTVPLTYANYLLMLPYLSDAQQEKIKGYLIEARELAMDGGTAKEKQAWFGKYKGRIANYLSAEGYQLKKEGDDWAKRRDTASKEIPVRRAKTVMMLLKLETANQDTRESVRNLIAAHYQKVAELTEQWNQKAKKIKDSVQISAEAQGKLEHESWLAMRADLDKKRSFLLERLSLFLSPAQVELVQAGMTNDKLNQEYNHFISLLPKLKKSEKKKVYNYLIEARDNAMNVSTDREINQWFSKFRGRANNYLAARGYNLRQATEEWERKYDKKSVN